MISASVYSHIYFEPMLRQYIMAGTHGGRGCKPHRGWEAKREKEGKVEFPYPLHRPCPMRLHLLRVQGFPRVPQAGNQALNTWACGDIQDPRYSSRFLPTPLLYEDT
jgi:hypothetical protein